MDKQVNSISTPKWYFTLLFFLLPTAMKAQDKLHFAFWSKLSVNKKIGKKWKIEADAQYRTQDDNDGNIFSLPLMYSSRIFLYYYPNAKWSFVVSPFSWFHSHALVIKPTYKSIEWDEYRLSFSSEYRYPLSKKATLLSRICAEPTFLERKNDNVRFVRLRWKEQANKSISSKVQLEAGAELFLNTISSEKLYTYNQSRGFAGIQYNLSKTVTLEPMYMYQHIHGSHTDIYYKSHNLLINARINL